MFNNEDFSDLDLIKHFNEPKEEFYFFKKEEIKLIWENKWRANKENYWTNKPNQKNLWNNL